MGYEARETEHAGPKRGTGAYWSFKVDAKKESNRVRRRADRSFARSGLDEDDLHALRRALNPWR